MNDSLISRFDRAILLLPSGLRRHFRAVPAGVRMQCEEIRLRRGKVPVLVLGREMMRLDACTVQDEDIRQIVDTVSGCSYHSVQQEMGEGFLTSREGYRLGLGGTVVQNKDGKCVFTNIRSLNIRISRQILGAAEPVLKQLTGKEIPSVLILSPPGYGKTTLLRDMIRLLGSDGEYGSYRMGVVDERNELSATCGGEPGFEMGEHTDVLVGCKKQKGIEMMLRSMNPQILCVDEITSEGDVQAMLRAGHCGVKLLATAHAKDRLEFISRPLYRQLSEAKVFQKLVTIRTAGGGRMYSVEDMEELC